MALYLFYFAWEQFWRGGFSHIGKIKYGKDFVERGEVDVLFVATGIFIKVIPKVWELAG